jgi:glycosyltransferase involved in cell wall biosynthesis
VKVCFFERKYIMGRISIEKVFHTIKPELIKGKVEVCSIKNPFPLNLIGVYKAIHFFRKNQSEINHITGDIHWIGLVLDPDKTILTIHDLVGLQQLKGLKRVIFYIFWIYLPIKKLKYITTVSNKTREEIIRLLPWATKKIRVIPNPITVKVNFNGIKQKSSHPIILIVGTRINKNLNRIIPALGDIQCDVRIVGELTIEQIDLLKTYGIRFANYINISDEELGQLYLSSDLLCFISVYEGFGLPILEAQANGCLVVTSAISPLNEVAGEGAVFVDPLSINDIRKGIVDVLTDDTLQIKLRTKGFENILKYHPRHIAEQYINLYKEVHNLNIRNAAY